MPVTGRGANVAMSRRGFLSASIGVACATRAAAQPRRSAPARVPSTAELPWLSITDAASLLRSRRLSPIELTQAMLDRIDRIEPRVHAFITVTRDEALRAAQTAEREIAAGRYRGPLHGIPFGVKDTHYTKGIRTTANTPVLSDFVPDTDATVVARLKQAGGVLIGKLSLPEFSFGGSAVGGGEFPDAVNPWDLSRTPGGSSSGSGAALAAGLVIAATGGDTSGSVRNPAALCGVVGMKPTYGRVSRHGIITISWSLDHVGPMTRTVRDNALMLNILAGHDPLDDSSSAEPVPDYTRALARGVRGMRMGIPKRPLIADYHHDSLRAFDEALAVLRQLGATIHEVEMPPTMDAIDDVQTIVRISEAASYHEPFLATKADRYGATNVRRDRSRLADHRHSVPARPEGAGRLRQGFQGVVQHIRRLSHTRLSRPGRGARRRPAALQAGVQRLRVPGLVPARRLLHLACGPSPRTADCRAAVCGGVDLRGRGGV